MASNNFFKSDLFDIHHVVQSSMLVYPKEIIIATLRDFFAKDSMYRYVKDEWGFPKVVDHTDLPIDAGINDDLTTRLYIGENYKFDGIYYPAILVKANSSRYVPISINREKGTIQYKGILYEDSHGNTTTLYRPDSFITAGAWEGQIGIDIMTKSLRARDDLVELVAMCFTEINVENLYDVGIIVKPPSISGPSESDDRNDKIFRQTISFDIRSEWRREIPIGNLIDTITFQVLFDNISAKPPSPALNLEINTELNLTDIILNT